MKKLIFNKNSKTHVEVFTNHKFLYDMEETRPKPASNYLPYWWKDMPRKTNAIDGTTIGTAKSCPSFAQMFSQGIVIPMWTDVIFTRKGKHFTWKTPDKTFQWEFHPEEQFLSYLNLPDNQTVYKSICPWFIKTNKNVSVYQFPMFFNFNIDYSVMPGIINTDYHWTINQQMIYTSKEDTFIIKRGEPFAWYVPFERSKFTFDVKVSNEKRKSELKDQRAAVFTKFFGHYSNEAKKREFK